MKKLLFCSLLISCFCLFGWASDFAPAVPNLDLPMDSADSEEQTTPVEPIVESQPKKKSVYSKTLASKKPTTAKQKKEAVAARNDDAEISVTNNLIKDDTEVEKVVVDESMLTPIPQELLEAQKSVPLAKAEQDPVPEKTAQNAVAKDSTNDAFVPAREEAQEKPADKPKKAKVVYNPATDRDPTLSPDDVLLLKHREEERLKAIELEKQRKIEAERKRLAELERKRQLELEYLRDPSREVRGKIRISGIIGQEVFVGNKVYTVGKSILGARIISVQPDSVVFIYKGQKFTKKVQLQ